MFRSIYIACTVAALALAVFSIHCAVRVALSDALAAYALTATSVAFMCIAVTALALAIYANKPSVQY